ncbi:MAG: LysE family translocator [Steroidobacteraceae bacterium]
MLPTHLLAFCASYFLIAVSPGLCMMLALSLGVSIGVRRALPMMLGEMAGIALVGAAVMAGIAALLLNAPRAFVAFKIAGAGYLLWAAWLTWKAPVATAGAAVRSDPRALFSQGFITAVSNPKAWVFQASLLPTFIDTRAALVPQAIGLLVLMVALEFASMLLYARGGRSFGAWLLSRGHGRILNRVSALLMVGVALWLLLG